MMDLEKDKSGQLSPVEYKALYEIGRVIIQVHDSETALREIVRLARPAFIFDNIILYESLEKESLEPTYARSVGRGRSAEADMEWGEKIAREVILSEDVVSKLEQLEGNQGVVIDARLNQRYYLGLPLDTGNEVSKALIFIRFGGPPYLDEQIKFAKLIAEHVEELLLRKHLLERVAALEAERRLDRLQEHFVATVSHELRSPLGFIKGYATTLLRDDTEWDPQIRNEFLTIIDEEADRLTGINDDMLDSSRLQAGTMPIEFQEVRLISVMNGFIQRMKAGKYDLEIHLEIDKSTSTIWADPGRLVQVFDNLVNNAAKYAPGAELTISLAWETDQAHIIFRDSGPGIPQEHLEDIFKRFYRLPQNRDDATGTGLGLFICHEIIQAHGGRIVAESQLGKGSEIHIYLPRKKVL
jgi:signal transduction histidine kinase